MLATLVGGFCIPLGAAGASGADQQKPSLLGRRSERILNEKLPELHLCRPVGQGTVLLIMCRGIRFATVIAVGTPGSQPAVLQRALQSAIRGTSLGNTPVISGLHHGTLPVARADLRRGQPGSREGSAALEVGQILARMRGQGLRPTAVISIPNYIHAAVPSPSASRDHHYRLYNGSSLPANYVLHVNARLSDLDMLLILTAAVILPALLIAVQVRSLLGRIRHPRSTPTTQKPFVQLVSLLLLQGDGILFAMLTLGARRSYYLLVDLWAGQSGGWPFLLPVAALCATFLAEPFTLHVIIRCITQPHQQPTGASLTPEEEAIRQQALRTGQRAHLLAGAIAITVMILLAATGVCRNRSGILLVVLTSLLTGVFVRWAFSRHQKRLPPDPELQNRMDNLARLMGIRPLRVEIVEQDIRATASLIRRGWPHKAIITAEAKNLLTPEELDYLLAYTAALARRGPLSSTTS